MIPHTNKMNRFEAAVFLRMSPFLIKWFTRHAPKQGDSQKLDCEVAEDGELYFHDNSLRQFDRYLAEPWPCEKSKRPSIPKGIESEIKRESSYRCVICSHTSGQSAHIDPVHNSMNNHPHNLIYLCPNCHDLYDKKKIIKQKDIRSIKKDILDTQVSIWRSKAGLLNTIFSLIRELEFIREKVKSSRSAAYQALQNELLGAIKSKAGSASSAKENPELSQRLLSAYDTKDEIDSLIHERETFIEDSNAAECPLCEGSGVHNNWECPVCRGDGTIDKDALDQIDLSPFEQVECPLCENSGVHNNWECPVCRGVGTIDKNALDEIDLSSFEQEECPLCEGSGVHNNWECPICRGVGTFDKKALDEIDLSPFEQEECPLCEGSGVHNNWECPVCRGACTVDKDALDEIDLSPFEQEKCPLCKGLGLYKDRECRVCRGIGTVDSQALSEIDISDFR